MPLTNVVLIISILVALSRANVDELSPQEKLLEKFFGKSRRLAEVLPKKNPLDGKPIVVHVGFIISHIYDIKSNEEEADLSLWMSYHWRNQLVNWNTSEYAVDRLEVDLDKIWTPKLFLVQNAMSKPLVPEKDKGIAFVSPDGGTNVDFATMVKVTCSMPACLFPADEHTCPLVFNAVSHCNKDLKLVYNWMVDKAYTQFAKNETGLWKIIRSNVTEAELTTSLTENDTIRKSSALALTLTFVRKPAYYWLTVVSPMVLICIVTFCSVLLPWESGERTSLLITCFLALIVFLDTILGSVPKTSDYVPVIVLFVILVLIFTITQITFTALASYYAERASKGKQFTAPHKKICNLISRIFFKKKQSNVTSFELDTRVDDEIEIERKFPPAVTRQVSRDVPERRASLGNSDATRRTSKANNFASIQESKVSDEKSGDFDGDESYEVSNPCAGKECRKACKLIDRISMSLSLILLVACPTVFHLMYTGQISSFCNP